MRGSHLLGANEVPGSAAAAIIGALAVAAQVMAVVALMLL